ncbi:MAG: Cytochrome-c peroxidase, partial [Phycisphaerales bacterium]|nr:Cytochrome-c peroxidase [Phycisphaerales bacterium]
AKHPPYLHDGSAKTLRDVIDFYNRGGNTNPHLDPKMKALNLTPDEVDDLVAFLESLNGEGYQDTPPGTFPQ